MNTLIVGGTKGLGLELARTMSEAGEVIVTGREDPRVDFAQFRKIDLTQEELPEKIGMFVLGLPDIDRLVYAPGFYQEGHITDLTDKQVDDMINVCGRGLVFFTKKLLEEQGKLDEVVTITSTSQRVPRELEAVYNFAKAAAGHYSNGLSLDPRVGKTLVAAPSGMASNFWEQTDKDTSRMMQPAWVAEQTIRLLEDSYTYREAKILGALGDLPSRVEIVETR